MHVFHHNRTDSLHHARPFLSTWATRLVAAEARKQIGFATVEDPDDDESHVRLRASSNGSGYTTAHVVTWNDFANFSVEALAEKFLAKLSLPMFLTQFMAAPKVDGDFFVRKRRPHPMIQVAALGSFILSRNPYATGYFAMLFGIWPFACKSHVDIK
ncbi:hypothetical protein R3P38DRAFT_3230913 [Favolaschia claudopus]|uniref:Uncharacterized protein n=1 Tax=Favolaschia claudopus TaxID=2862362 RepID=A0AAV9ZM01_9AGAR